MRTTGAKVVQVRSGKSGAWVRPSSSCCPSLLPAGGTLIPVWKGIRVGSDMIVTVGVDTHTDVHAAAVLYQAGRLLATESFPATTRGYAQLATWAESFGTVDKVGMEGTGHFGAGLLRFLADFGLVVVEVDRPDRSARRRNGKSDPLDAESAARAVQSGKATGTPKSRYAQVEMIRVLRVARKWAMTARIQAGAQIDAVILAAPEPVRSQFRKLSLASESGLPLPCAPARCMTPQPRPKPRCVPWPAAGKLCKPRSMTSIPSSPRLSPPWLLSWSPCPEWAWTPPGSCWSPPGTTPAGCVRNAPSPACVASRRFPLPRGAPAATGCTAAETVTPTAPCGGSPWSGCTATSPPRTTSPAAPPKARPRPKSSAALKRYIARETYPYLIKLTSAQARHHVPRPLALTPRRETA
jgi:hypothetical protein